MTFFLHMYKIELIPSNIFKLVHRPLRLSSKYIVVHQLIENFLWHVTTTLLQCTWTQWNQHGRMFSICIHQLFFAVLKVCLGTSTFRWGPNVLLSSCWKYLAKTSHATLRLVCSTDSAYILVWSASLVWLNNYSYCSTTRVYQNYLYLACLLIFFIVVVYSLYKINITPLRSAVLLLLPTNKVINK